MQSEKNVPKCSCQLLLHNSPRFNGKHAAHPLPATNYHRESCLGSDCSSVLSALNPSRPSCSGCSTAPPAPPPKSQPPTGHGIKATKWKTSTAPYYLDVATPRNYGKPAKAQGLLPLNAEAGVWHSSEHPAPAEFPPEHPRWAPREKGPAKNEDKDAEHHRVCPDSTGAHSLQL